MRRVVKQPTATPKSEGFERAKKSLNRDQIVFVNCRVSRDLKKQFIHSVSCNNTSMQAVLDKFIIGYIKQSQSEVKRQANKPT